MGFFGKIGVVCALAAMVAVPANAKESKVDQAGTAVAIALPLAAGTVTILHDDWNGLGELLVVTGATVGTAYVLKQVVHEERPDHSDMKSFPSEQAALAFAPASYLWDRYGWEYGAPAYLAAAFTGYTRVDAQRHHWWDVATSAGIGFAFSKIFTTEFHRPYNVYAGAYVTPHDAYVDLEYHF